MELYPGFSPLDNKLTKTSDVLNDNIIEMKTEVLEKSKKIGESILNNAQFIAYPKKSAAELFTVKPKSDLAKDQQDKPAKTGESKEPPIEEAYSLSVLEVSDGGLPEGYLLNPDATEAEVTGGYSLHSDVNEVEVLEGYLLLSDANEGETIEGYLLQPDVGEGVEKVSKRQDENMSPIAKQKEERFLQQAKQDIQSAVKALDANEQKSTIPDQDMGKKVIRKLDKEIQSLVGDKAAETVIDYIDKQATLYFQEALQSGKSQEIYIDQDKKLIFTPSGKVYASIQKLGTGSFKATYKVALIAAKEMEAIANDQLKIRAFSITLKGLKDINKNTEIMINQYLKGLSKTHDLSHVISIKSVRVINGNRVGIMSESCAGDIDRMISSRKEKQLALTEQEKINILTQMAKGVKQLHEVKVVHRDIKPNNFLYKIDADGKLMVKIADFGTSSLTEKSKRTSLEEFFLFSSDPAWHESKKKKVSLEAEFSPAWDVYQLGLTMCQILNGYTMKEWEDLQKKEMDVLQPAITDEGASAEVKREDRIEKVNQWKLQPDKWAGISTIEDPAIRKFVRQMVDPNPAKRPAMDAVLNFFESRNVAA